MFNMSRIGYHHMLPCMSQDVCHNAVYCSIIIVSIGPVIFLINHLHSRYFKVFKVVITFYNSVFRVLQG